MADAFVCWNCGNDLADEPLPLSRHANCSRCYTELHCCRLCANHDRHAVDECLDDRAEPPHNKEGANFCEFFKPRLGAFAGGTADKAASAKSRLDALFGGADDDAG